MNSWKLLCPHCKYFNVDFLSDQEVLRCGPRPSGPVGGKCSDYEKAPPPKRKRLPKISYLRSGPVASCDAKAITEERGEILFLQEIEDGWVAKHFQGGVVHGLYVYLEKIPPDIRKQLSFASRLPALKRNGIKTLYLDLRGA